MGSDQIKRPLVVFIDYILEHKGNDFYSDDSHIIFTQAIQKEFAKSTICSRLSPSPRNSGIEISSDISNVQPLPYYTSLVSFCKQIWTLLPKTVKLIRRHVEKDTVLWLAWPHPISLVLLMLYGRKNKVFVTIRQNLRELMKVRYSGVTRTFALAFVDLLNLMLRVFYKNVLVFTTGKEMYNIVSATMSNVNEIKTPVISRKYKATYEVANHKEETNLLFVGRLEPEKGLFYLIESVDLLKKSSLNVHLHLVGDGTEKDGIVKRIQELKLENDITLHGYLTFGDELLKHYRSASYFVLPSISEGFPKVINEARAFGIPIISTKCGGVVHEIEHKVNGYFVEKKSPSSIADAVHELNGNPDLAGAISQNELRDFDVNNMEYHQEKVIEILRKHFSLED